MAKEDLIPLKKGTARARKIARLGGSTKSPKKNFKAKLRELKKKGLTDNTMQRLVELVEDPQSSLIDLRQFIDSIDIRQLNFTQKIQLGSLMISWHRAAHGDKIRGENLNINMNIDQEEFQRRIENWEKSFWEDKNE